MGARQKLNSAYLSGSILLAALIGYAFGSWWIFVLAAVALVASNLAAGEIRPGKDKKGRGR